MGTAGVTHVTTELAPHVVTGGLGFGLRRLIEQLAREGVRSRVLLEDRTATLGRHEDAWGHVMPLPVGGMRYEQLGAMAEQAVAILGQPSGYDRAVVTHDNECAAVLALLQGAETRRMQRVHWLHSVSDRPAERLPSAIGRRLPSGSLTAGAIAAADLCVTSAGVMADAEAFEWPEPLRAMQRELVGAQSRGAVLCVGPDQSLGAEGFTLPQPTSHPPPRPFVLFAARPNVNKGLPVFLEIAARFGHLDVDFLVTGDPPSGLDMRRRGAARVRWSGWQPQAELFSLIASARAVLVPSLSEGFGMGAAEALRLGARVIHHDIGGLRSLPECSRRIPVPLEVPERATLYEIWASFFEREPAQQWSLWDRARPRLDAVLARWFDRVEVTLREDPRPVFATLCPRAPSWGDALAGRLRP